MRKEEEEDKKEKLKEEEKEKKVHPSLLTANKSLGNPGRGAAAPCSVLGKGHRSHTHVPSKATSLKIPHNHTVPDHLLD